MSNITISVINDNNLTKKLSSDTTIFNVLTDGVLTAEGDTITNIIDPIELQDGFPKSFAVGSVTPSEPAYSIQYNHNSTFDSDPDFKFESDILIVDSGFEDFDGLTIRDNLITGITNPTEDSQIVNKQYIDSLYSSYRHIIDSDSNVIYTPSQMKNSIIIRNWPSSVTSITDTTASATSIVNSLTDPIVGQTFTFVLSNIGLFDGEEGVFNLTLNAGADVTFNPSTAFVIPRNYVLNAYMIITNVNTPAVTIILNSCSNMLTSLFSPSVKITNNLLFNLNNDINTDADYEYTSEDIRGTLITRNPAANSADKLTLKGTSYLQNSQIFTVQNISANTIDITADTDLIDIIYPITIPANRSAQIVVEYIGTKSIVDGTGYTLNEVCTTTGGSGTGLTLSVKGVSTDITIDDAGSGYVAGVVETENLTNPGATGLRIYILSVSSGAVSVLFPILAQLPVGYQNGDSIRLLGGNEDAIISLSNVNGVNQITILDYGDGLYQNSDIINIVSGLTGTGASFEPDIEYKVSLIGITPI